MYHFKRFIQFKKYMNFFSADRYFWKELYEYIETKFKHIFQNFTVQLHE